MLINADDLPLHYAVSPFPEYTNYMERGYKYAV